MILCNIILAIIDNIQKLGQFVNINRKYEISIR